ncbi:Olfactory receptor 4C12 [Lonchura striata]|uniref:Olfactory receptor 4C12 n=1 Tax=Lonchura striata TaxID=40157 RepID=A0A218UUH5_9PASE|nr:Olfactory receptor 4C12 [Lonchura striata domestica]
MKEFILLGLSENRGVQKIYFVVFLLFYILTVAGNLIVLTVTNSRDLNSPMYFFLCHLSFVDVCYSSVTAPQIISGFLVENKTISFAGCIGQLFGLNFFGCTEVFIRTAMACNGCVAICQPLHYSALVSRCLCSHMVGVSWAGGFLHSILQTLPPPFSLSPNKVTHYFCYVHPLLPLACADTHAEGLVAVANSGEGTRSSFYYGKDIGNSGIPFLFLVNEDSYFCDVPPVIRLACADTTLTEWLMASNSGLISLGCFLVLVASYTLILAKVRARVSQGNWKALSTCASHMMAVTLLFMPCIFTYLRPAGTLPTSKYVCVIYTIFSPMMNPLIYTLRSSEVKESMWRLWKHCRTS